MKHRMAIFDNNHDINSNDIDANVLMKRYSKRIK